MLFIYGQEYFSRFSVFVNIQMHAMKTIFIADTFILQTVSNNMLYHNML